MATKTATAPKKTVQNVSTDTPQQAELKTIKKNKTVTKVIAEKDVAAPAKTKPKKVSKSLYSKPFDPKLLEKLKAIISPYTEYPELLEHIEKGTNVNFVDKLKIDSVDVVEIVVDVELEFDISIADEEIKTFTTFEEMYNLIEQKIHQSAQKASKE